LPGNRDGDAARAESHFQNFSRRIFGDLLESDINKRFRFRSGYQDSVTNIKAAAVKLASSHDVRQWFPLCSTLYQLSHYGAFVIGQQDCEIRVETNALTLSSVSQQKFSLEPWRFNSFLLQE
jgi:hypothetical protein